VTGYGGAGVNRMLPSRAWSTGGRWSRGHASRM
jgi:hypothetical protein